MDCLVPALVGLMLVTFTVSKPLSSSSESSQSSSSEEIPAQMTTPKPAEPQSVKKNLQQVMTQRSPPCTEQTIPHDITEQTIPHDITEQTIPHDITEQTIPHDITEQTIPHDITEQTIQHDIREQTIQHDITEQTIQHDITEQTIHHDITEQTIQHDITEQTDETVIRINLIPLPPAVSAKPDEEDLRASYSSVTISTVQNCNILLNSSVTNPLNRGDNI